MSEERRCEECRWYGAPTAGSEPPVCLVDDGCEDLPYARRWTGPNNCGPEGKLFEKRHD